MARSVAAVIALGRLALGAALLLAPTQAARGWLGDEVDRPSVVELVRGIGVRDLALGAGLFAALRADGPARAWLAAGVAADVGDTAAALAVGDGIPARGRWATVAIAGGSALVGLGLLRDRD